MAYAKAGNGPANSSGKLQFLFKFFPRPPQGKTYILPTLFGIVFGLLALILLMMAMSYANNLIYLYTFALISVGLSSMYLTNENVKRLKFVSVKPGPMFANEINSLFVQIENPTASYSSQLKLRVRGATGQGAIAHCGGRKLQTCSLPWTPPVRGFQEVPRIVLQSEFPFGLLRSWKTFESREKVLVYPHRRGDRQFPVELRNSTESGSMGLFRDHRRYQSTDSPRRVDWRATAKARELLVKNFEGAENPYLDFDWRHTEGLSQEEDRLSQLTLWISRAQEMGLEYSLTLPGFESGRAQGVDHDRKCFERLALWESKS